MPERETVRFLVVTDEWEVTREYVERELQALDPRSDVVLVVLTSSTERGSFETVVDAPYADARVVRVSRLRVPQVVGAVEANGVTQVLLAPTVGLDARRLSTAAGVPVEMVPDARSLRRRPFRHQRGARRFLAVFTLSYAFYLFLGDPFSPFDLATGAVSAGVVALVSASIVVEEEPSVRRTTGRLLRATVFLPYLLFEIVRANLAVARVILDPRLPIDPRMVRLDPGTENRLHRAVLANAITLTPGTVTVEIDEEGFLVHTLTDASRRGLESGSLQRAVAFVFGREAP